MEGKKLCFAVTLPNTAYCFAAKQMKMLLESSISVTLASSTDNTNSANQIEGVIFKPVRIKRGLSIKGLILGFIDYYRLFKKEKYDIVMYATPNAALAASLAAFAAGIKVRLYCQMGLKYIAFTGFKNILFKFLERIPCLLATHIEPVSHENLEFAVEEGLFKKEKAVVLGKGSSLGIDLSVFDISKKERWRAEIRDQLSLKDEDLVFGYVGRITRDKGTNELLVAFKDLLHIKPHAKLMLVGLIEEEKGLNLQLLNWALGSKEVIWTSSVVDVQRYIAAMDIFVFPTYREGFGQVSLEAQAMAVPLIASNIRGPRESTIPGKSALLVDPCSTSQLGEAMLRLAEDKDLRQKLGACGLKNVTENYDDRKFLPLLIKRRLELLNIENERYKKSKRDADSIYSNGYI